MLSSASDKAKLFAENFSKNSNLDDSVSLYLFFLLELILKLHNISVTPKMVKKVIMNLDLSKASGPDCIPVVVLKNCEPELSYILAELFNKCLKESCFPDCLKVSSVVPVFKNVGERSTAKNYRPVSPFSVVGKVFEKLLNKKIVDHLEKCGLFFISSMVLGLLDQLQIFSQLYLIELLGLSTGLGLLKLWQLICPRLLTGFGMLVFFTNLSLVEFQVRYLALFLLFSVIGSFEWFWMESLHKNIQVMLEFLKAPFLVLHFSYYTLMTFPDDVIYSKCDQASDLWQQLELASELESDLQDIVDWGKKWLVDFNAGETQLVSFDQSNNNGSIDMKMDGSALDEKSSFKMLGVNLF